MTYERMTAASIKEALERVDRYQQAVREANEPRVLPEDANTILREIAASRALRPGIQSASPRHLRIVVPPELDGGQVPQARGRGRQRRRAAPRRRPARIVRRTSTRSPAASSTPWSGSRGTPRCRTGSSSRRSGERAPFSTMLFAFVRSSCSSASDRSRPVKTTINALASSISPMRRSPPAGTAHHSQVCRPLRLAARHGSRHRAAFSDDQSSEYFRGE